MGGGLARLSALKGGGTSAASYLEEPAPRKKRRRRAKNGKRLTMAELKRQWAIEDRLHAERMREREERILRQNEAIRHVDAYFYAYAPTTKRVAKYPASSPKAGQKYLWIKLDHRKYDKKKLEETLNYPESVVCDRFGHIYVVERAGDPPEMITSGEILAARTIPRRPEAPTLREATQNAIIIEWEMIRARVDVWAVEWQPAGSIGEWKSVTDMTKQRYATLANLDYATSVVFRVRAHNVVGWSEWGKASRPLQSLPGPPATPSCPKIEEVTATTISLEWDRVKDNGSPVQQYVILAKKVEELDAEFCVAATCRADSTSHTLTHLEDRTLYYLKVVARNAVGDSAPGYVSAAHTKEAPIEATGQVLRQRGPWREYWDERRGRCVYINDETGARQKIMPFLMREGNGVADPDVDFRRKRYRFLRGVRTDFAAALGNSPASPKNAVHVPVLRVRRQHVYEDTLRDYTKFSQTHPCPAMLRWRVEFDMEDGIDSGGLTKEWYQELSKAIVSPKQGLFCQRPDGSIGISPDSFKITDALLHFRFCGVMLAKALAERCIVGISYDWVLTEALLSSEEEKKADLEDLRELDPTFAASLQWIVDNDVTANGLDETLCFTRLDGRVVDFVDNGRNIDVTEQNKSVYVHGMVRYKLFQETEQQRNAFVEGFHSVVTQHRLSEFSSQHLRLMMNGLDDFNTEEFARACQFAGGIDEDSVLVTWFWDILRDMDAKGRRALLRFVTGCPAIPLDGFDPEFTIVLNESLSVDALPRSHTCFNRIVLPPYATVVDGKQRLREKLIYACEHSTIFGLT